MDDHDRRRLSARVGESAEDFGVRIFLYCWMPNHGHLVIETPRGNLSAFMSSVLTGYTVYFNLRHGRCGHLMQGRFKSQVVSGDDYLLRLSRYVHLNPVMTSLWKNRPLDERRVRLRQFAWSSFRGYASLGPQEQWVSESPLLLMMPPGKNQRMGYRRYVETGMSRTDDEFAQLVSDAALALGPMEFCERMTREHEALVGRKAKREDVSLRHIGKVESVERVLSHVAGTLGMELTGLRRKRRDGTPRALAALALMRRCGLTQRAAAEQLGLSSGSAVSYLVRHLKNRIQNDHDVMSMAEAVLISHFQG
jgi:REP element-mobilizing transposase RayT